MSKLRVGGILKTSLVNGPGSRYVVFTSGCKHNCYGCHNKELQDYTYGKDISVDELVHDIVEYYHAGLIQGVTISGGEPIDQHLAVEDLVSQLNYSGIEDIWIYSGYKYEAIEYISPYLLRAADTLVDGKFEYMEHSYDLKYKGSKNQRIINLRCSTVDCIVERIMS